MDAQQPPPHVGTRTLWRPVLWRGLAFAAAYLAGLSGLLAGVGVSERDLAGAGLAQLAYYTVGLFVLGGLDLGTPVGGPALGRALLWTAYFVAPVITASALAEAAVRLIRPLAIRVRRLSDHVVLAGAGRLTLLYVRKLRADHPRRRIVVVEVDPNHPSLTELQDVYGAVTISGDISRDEVLQGLQLARAHRVLLLTGNDYANLDAAAKILRLAPGMAGRMVVHVSDLAFVRATADSSVARACEIFNGHEFAARYLVREHLLGRFRRTPELDLVVLAGFGRFGQTVLHQLQERALGSFSQVVIIDAQATKNARVFDHQLGFEDGYGRLVMDGDLLDPEIWDRVGEEVEKHGHDPVVILGSGIDGTNLHAAFLVRERHPSAFVVVRSFQASPFTVEMAKEIDAQAFSLAELVESGMPAGWF